MASNSTEVGKFLKKNKTFRTFPAEIHRVVDAAEGLYRELLRKKNMEEQISMENKLYDIPNLIKLVDTLNSLKESLLNFRMDKTNISTLGEDTGASEHVKRLTDVAVESIEEMR